jgi:high-affinity iron transporter
MYRFASALLLSTLFLNLTSAHAASAAPVAGTAPRTLVHLLDYLARDYAGAVQDGKVLSESEYAEQVEFAKKLGEIEAQVQYPTSVKKAEVTAVDQGIHELNSLVNNKASPEKVAELARHVRADVIRLSGIVTTPAQTPDLAQGQKLFAQRCASCHGAQGFGDGAAAASLNPKPINFHDPKIMADMSPLQIFNAVRLGVDGTAMAPQADLQDQDTWNISYFALSLYSGSNGGNSDGSGGGAGGNSLGIARHKLTEAAAEYRAGHLAEAQDKALAAYLEGFEPIEPKLKANDPEFVTQIESLMMKVRQTIDGREPVASVDAAVSGALAGLQEVEGKMARSEMSPYMSFTAAAAILLREGFEAVLVVLAFLGVVRTSGNRRAEKWLHGGWIVAVGLGVVAWFFSGWLIGISGAQREAMEAITAFFAAAVLLFVGFWLHQKTEINRWKAFVETQVKTALEQKSLFGLAMISFIAVFRETLETVLFLRAIWVDCGPAAKNGLAAGVAASFLVTLILAWLTLSFSRKIPIRQLFTISSSVMAALAVMLIGKGIHSLQETGTLSITSMPVRFHSEFFGIFPTWETMVSQLLIVGVISFLWNQGRRRPASLPVTSAQA